MACPRALAAIDFCWRAFPGLPAAERCCHQLLNDFTPLVERISIDEAFADVAGCTHLFGSPPEIARAVRHRVRAELGLPISIGVARTKHLAKIASQVAKPDGLVVVDPEAESDFLYDLPVELMWGVGLVTAARLAEIGVHTIGQLAKLPGWSLERIVGRATGEKLAALAWKSCR
jgi:DNA polymerase IV